MKKTYKYLLLTEVIICFAPAYILLSMGLIFIPYGIIELFSGNYEALILAFVVIGGFLGITALITLLIKIFNPNKKMLPRNMVIIFMLAGFITLLSLLMTDLVNLNFPPVVLMLPLLSSIHVAYLGRRFLFNKTANNSLNLTGANNAPPS